MDIMGKLVLLRHGESLWNKKNIFTGWVDIPLSETGVDEAVLAGDKIAHIDFNVMYVSTLIRAQMTGFIALAKCRGSKVPVFVSEHPHDWEKSYSNKEKEGMIPVYQSSALNERYYGELQGKNKDEIKKEVGEVQFKLWRRSYDTPPPKGESLKMTIERTMPYFKEKIIPHLDRGENVLIAAHGNSLRGIVMYLDNLSHDEVVHLEIPTGQPILYHYDSGKWGKKSL